MAGGRWEVAFNLHTLRGIPTTLIDPRPQKLSKKQHAQLQTLNGTEPDDNLATVWIASMVRYLEPQVLNRSSTDLAGYCAIDHPSTPCLLQISSLALG